MVPLPDDPPQEELLLEEPLPEEPLPDEPLLEEPLPDEPPQEEAEGHALEDAAQLPAVADTASLLLLLLLLLVDVQTDVVVGDAFSLVLVVYVGWS